MRAPGATALAQLFGFLAIILLLVWLLHYREGIDYDSEDGYRVFNVHPLLMFLGFIFFGGQAIMAYQYETTPSDRPNLKFLHMLLHLIAITLGIVGLCAVFKFHDMANIVNLYSLHSWIGIGTFSLYCLQWLLGLVTFMLPGTLPSTRYRVAPLHIAAGRALLFMAVCAALTGLMEKFAFLGQQVGLQPHQRESHLINFTGLAILLFGVFVDMSIGLSRFVRVD